jgi:DNA-binding IclR family transcriptional regulator
VTSPGPQAGAAARTDIQAVDRIGQILGLFTENRTHVTAGAVAENLGLNRTTAHRYLTSMAAEDLLEATSNPPGYRLGSLVLRLGGLTMGQDRVITIAAEAMVALADEVGTTISLGLWTSAGPVIAHVQQPQGRNLVLSFRTGTVLPYDTAQAAIFLAFRQDAEDSDRTIQSLPEPARSIARTKITEARRTGVATAVTEENGTWGIAAPIFDATGICAALAVVDTISSMSNSTFPHRLTHLQRTASELSARLGGHVPTPVD